MTSVFGEIEHNLVVAGYSQSWHYIWTCKQILSLSLFNQAQRAVHSCSSTTHLFKFWIYVCVCTRALVSMFLCKYVRQSICGHHHKIFYPELQCKNMNELVVVDILLVLLFFVWLQKFVRGAVFLNIWISKFKYCSITEFSIWFAYFWFCWNLE